jgi:hypothetical protein
LETASNECHAAGGTDLDVADLALPRSSSFPRAHMKADGATVAEFGGFQHLLLHYAERVASAEVSAPPRRRCTL